MTKWPNKSSSEVNKR